MLLGKSNKFCQSPPKKTGGWGKKINHKMFGSASNLETEISQLWAIHVDEEMHPDTSGAKFMTISSGFP